MFKRGILTTAVIVLLALATVGVALAATIDSSLRTVTTPKLFVDFSETNPEEIVDIRWNGSANLTNHAPIPDRPCTDDLEYFGNSWVSEDEGTPGFYFATLVGWGTTGSWNALGSQNVSVHSSSTGCYGSAGIPVNTRYRFWDHGPMADRIRVTRTFNFGRARYRHDVRGYIPRLYPLTDYTQVIHPNASGTALVTETPSACPFGCRVDDWNDTWLAIHNPATGSGLIVRHVRSRHNVALWIDEDSQSETSASGVLLLPPRRGFSGRVTEIEYLCFYDSTTWTPSRRLPRGC